MQTVVGSYSPAQPLLRDATLKPTHLSSMAAMPTVGIGYGREQSLGEGGTGQWRGLERLGWGRRAGADSGLRMGTDSCIQNQRRQMEGNDGRTWLGQNDGLVE